MIEFLCLVKELAEFVCLVRENWNLFNGVLIFVRDVLIFAKPKKAKKIENPSLYPFRISPYPTRARKIVSKVDESVPIELGWTGLIDFADKTTSGKKTTLKYQRWIEPLEKITMVQSPE